MVIYGWYTIITSSHNSILMSGSPGPPYVCGLCGLHPPSVICHQCNQHTSSNATNGVNGSNGSPPISYWYCTKNGCDDEVHRATATRNHKRTPFGEYTIPYHTICHTITITTIPYPMSSTHRQRRIIIISMVHGWLRFSCVDHSFLLCTPVD